MKKYLPLSLLFVILFNFCKGQDSSGELPYAFLQAENAIHPQLRGIWRSVGGGYMWDAREDSFQLYSYTRSYCYKEWNDYLEGMMHSEARFRFLGDTLRIFLTDYGVQTPTLGSPWDFVRIVNFPRDPLSQTDLRRASPKLIFDLFLENLSENYAFSREREMNWELIHKEYEPMISDSTSHDSLFQLMGEIVLQTEDQHTKLFNKAGKKIQYTYVPSSDTIISSFHHQKEIKTLNKYFGKFFEGNYQGITDSLLLGKGKKALKGKLEWGKITDRVGYLHIHQFSDFVQGRLPRKEQIDSLNHYMAEAISSLSHTEALIIDVSFNFGGFDAASLTFASYFAQEKVKAYENQVFYQGDFHTVSQVYVSPADSITYSKPVYLLTSDISRSAAEGFVMAMKALPQVIHVGQPTLGILSGMLNKSFGGFLSTCSYQRLLSPSGQYFEVSGVEPEIEIAIFNRPNVMRGHLDAVRDLVKMIKD